MTTTSNTAADLVARFNALGGKQIKVSTFKTKSLLLSALEAAEAEFNAKQKSAKQAKSTKRTVAADQVTLADIARDLGMSPKVARQKLRRAKDLPRSTEGWVFAASDRAAVVKALGR
jgi:hypothetical protein